MYFGEKFEKEQLLRLAERFLLSLCIGNWIAVYFERDTLIHVQENLRHLVLEKFPEGEGCIPPNALGSLNISAIESSRPYTVLVKFLIWLYKNYDAEKNPSRKRLLQQIIEDIKNSTSMLYLMPRTKSEYMLIIIPSLNIFTSLWLENDKRRKILEAFSRHTYIFINRVLGKAGVKERRKAENELEILVNALELFYRDLVESGRISYEPLRKAIDQIIYLSQRYQVPYTLSFMKYLLL